MSQGKVIAFRNEQGMIFFEKNDEEGRTAALTKGAKLEFVFSLSDTNFTDATQYGDLLIEFPKNQAFEPIESLHHFMIMLISRYAVEPFHVTPTVDSSGDIFLRVCSRSFAFPQGSIRLINVYKRVLDCIMKESGWRYGPVNVVEWWKVESVQSQKIFLRKNIASSTNVALENLKRAMKEAYDKINKPSFFFSASVSDIAIINETLNSERDCFSLLSKLYYESHSSELTGNFYSVDLRNLERCDLLRAVAASTVWQNENELKGLSGVCRHLKIKSYRWLCIALGVSNRDIQLSDEAFIKFVQKSECIDLPTCSELRNQFAGCSEKCGVTTPAALPYHQNLLCPSKSFEVDDKWVCVVRNGQREILCSALQVDAAVSWNSDHSWGILLSFKDARGARKRLAVAAKDVLSQNFGTRLVEWGIQVKPHREATSLIQEYIIFHSTSHVLQATPYAGWHGCRYVNPSLNNTHSDMPLPDGRHDIIEQVFLQPSSCVNPYVIRGTVEGWLNSLQQNALFCSDVLLVLGIALAGPLLRLLDFPGFIFHLWGGDKSFRQYLVRMASSIWGSEDFAKKWRYTADNISSISAMHNDSLVCLMGIPGKNQTKVSNLLNKQRKNSFSDSGIHYPLKHVVLSEGDEVLDVKAGQGCSRVANVINIEVSKLSCSFDVSSIFANCGIVGHSFILYLEGLLIGCEAYTGEHRLENYSLNVLRRDVEDFVIKHFSKLDGKTCSDACLAFAVAHVAFNRFVSSNISSISHIINSQSVFSDAYVMLLSNRTESERVAVNEALQIIKTKNFKIVSSYLCVFQSGADGFMFERQNKNQVLIPTASFEMLFCRTVDRKRMVTLLRQEGVLLSQKGSASVSRWVPGLKKAIRGYVIKV